MVFDVGFLAYSLAWGSTLALMACGLSLYYSVSRVANFAHGEYASIGVIAYLLFSSLASGGLVKGYDVVHVAALTLDRVWVLVPTFLAGAGAAVCSFVLVFWPLMRRGAKPLQLMVASIGLMFVIRFLLYVAASDLEWLSLPSPGSTVYRLAGIRVELSWVVSSLLAVLVVVSIALFTSRTLLGVSLRAVADDPELAEASGVNSFRVQLLAWSIGGGLAAVGGALMFVLTGPPGERPIVELGWMNLLPIFAAATLGGLGSFYGTYAGSLILGLAFNQAASTLLDLGLDPQLALAVPFTVTLLVLLFMPRGLAGIDWAGLAAKLRARLGGWLSWSS